METAKCLQRLVMPNARFGASESMYIRGSLFSFSENIITVFPGGKISFDTYYNGFSTILWKEKCGIHDLAFNASGTGLAKISALLITEEMSRYELASATVSLNSLSQEIFTLDLADTLNRGIIYIEITPINGIVSLNSGEWFTNQSPRRKVKLGISITHFDRKKYVIPSMMRIKREILENDDYRGLIDFTVIDNSKNITAREANGIRVIPNKNTGGAGGFMRGLLHYIDEGDFTHTLFMDDDASCEAECIKKTYSVLSYALNDNAAVSGSLFTGVRPDALVEKGAFFDRVCHPIYSGWRLNDVESLVKTETLMQFPNYGAWWFFAFPINHVKSFAFPFFVRGDDILFGMMNDFDILTTNGIACYAEEDFSSKTSPLTAYLDTRNHLVNMLYFGRPVKDIIGTYTSFHLKSLLAHQYGSAAAINLAFKHVYGDPGFWKNNADMKDVREALNAITFNEKMKPISPPDNSVEFKCNFETKSRRLFRIITLNGFLAPSKNKIIYQEKTSGVSLRQIFRYKKVFYYDRGNKTGYIAEASKKQQASGFIEILFNTLKIILASRTQRKKYSEVTNKLTTEEFWRSILIRQ